MTRTARFRFYGSLNDFLAPDRRQRTVRYDFSGRPAVKDSIEALGVPHPEVALVAVGGNPVGFDHRLSPGERIAVYPSFRGLKIGPAILLQPPPLPEPAFILDVHLGKPARWLRMLGFDRLPPRTRREHRRFKICSGCGKIYWPGSHHRAMQSRIARLTDVHYLSTN